MLVELSIRDLALFERAELAFEGGLNAVTGETGAGKSLLIGALELLLGHTPKGDLVRRGAEHALVEGRFVFAPGAAADRLVEWLRAHAPAVLDGREADEELELVLSRRLSKDGRTRAHLDQRPVTRRVLRELAGMLVEIHGQNEHQRLLDPAEQTRLVDAFGKHDGLLADYRAKRARWLELGERLRGWAAEERERRDRVDLLRFQLGELDEAGVGTDEPAALREERALLRNAAELGRELGGVAEDLVEGEGAALDRLRAAERALERWESKVTTLAAPAEELREAVARLEEAGALLRRFLDELDFEPGRLEEVEERLAEIERLELRHRCEAARLPEMTEALRAELEGLEARGSDLESLARERLDARRELAAAAEALTKARKKLRARLKRAVEGALGELGLEKAEFGLALEPRAGGARGGAAAGADDEHDGDDAEDADDADDAREAADRGRFGPAGADRLELLLAANPGEGLAPLRAVASGGEAARIMLALRGALASRQAIPTLVFDEVDAGVGGRVAPLVGSHLRALGAHYQILCVTHLPAVAAAADRHLRVEKASARGRTTTRVTLLAGEPRVAEVADMISGGAGQRTALAEARRLLGQA